jgi:hypothetical protein
MHQYKVFYSLPGSVRQQVIVVTATSRHDAMAIVRSMMSGCHVNSAQEV